MAVAVETDKKICSRCDKLKLISDDHNHLTNEVRGLLCVRCNNALGGFKVDSLGVLNLQMAIKYLKGTIWLPRVMSA